LGKRSDFPRTPRDLYPTPLRAVEPLIPYLRAGGIRTFAEPCYGKGDLSDHLESFGFRCTYYGDITTGQDARKLTRRDCNGAHAIVTNPPHTRALMHELIEHFITLDRPVWLLIDLDWVANLQAGPYLPRCSNVVIIGRVKWIAGTEHTGKENYGWYRFAGSYKGPTQLHNDRKAERG
jgi:hypothetical protein